MKKVLSIILSTCVLLSCAIVPGYAKAGTKEIASLPQGGDGYPFILIRGVSLNGLYLNYGTDKQEEAMKPITAGGVATAVLKAAGSGLVHLSFDRAMDEVFGYAGDILGSLGCNKDGTSTYDIGLPRYPLSVGHYREELITGGGRGAEDGIVKSAAERLGEDNVYFFTYDWRLNPLEICDEINDMVNLALKEHNASKVNIVSCSMGGIETVAYLSKYGYDKINKCFFLSSTIYGLYIVSDLFCGRVTVSEQSLYNFLSNKAEGNAFGALTVKALYKTGALKLAAGFADKFIGKYKDKAFDKVLRDTFATMPVWWGLMQPKDYNDALQYMFGGREDEYAGVIAISKELQALMAGRDKLLKAAEANGVKFAVVANYDSSPLPVYERACSNSDGGLETALVSGGGTVADYGKTLGNGYIPKNPVYLSPDRVIDASTCLFPDSTWFVKDGNHVGCSYGTEYSDFLFWMVNFNGQPTVFSSAAYPQFLISGKDESIKTW